MKKLIFFTILFLVISYIYAQKFTGGIACSPLVSWMKPDVKGIEFRKAKLGFNFGAVLDYNLSDNFAFSTGVMVNNMGGCIRYKDTIPTFETADSIYKVPPDNDITYNLQFIEFPFGLKGQTNEIGYITYFLKAGLNPMVRTKAKGDLSGQTKLDIREEVVSFTFGYHIGGGILYSLTSEGNTSILAEIVFTNGLFDVTTTKVYDTATSEKDDGKVILNNVAIRLGIVF